MHQYVKLIVSGTPETLETLDLYFCDLLYSKSRCCEFHGWYTTRNLHLLDRSSTFKFSLVVARPLITDLHSDGHSLKVALNVFQNKDSAHAYLKYIYIYMHTLHYITLHYITLHYITSHHISFHFISFHYITLHYITLHSHTHTHT